MVQPVRTKKILFSYLVRDLQRWDNGLDVGDLLLAEEDEGIVVLNLGA